MVVFFFSAGQTLRRLGGDDESRDSRKHSKFDEIGREESRSNGMSSHANIVARTVFPVRSRLGSRRETFFRSVEHHGRSATTASSKSPAECMAIHSDRSKQQYLESPSC